jgi:hypothetical protein
VGIAEAEVVAGDKLQLRKEAAAFELFLERERFCVEHFVEEEVEVSESRALAVGELCIGLQIRRAPAPWPPQRHLVLRAHQT